MTIAWIFPLIFTGLTACAENREKSEERADDLMGRLNEELNDMEVDWESREQDLLVYKVVDTLDVSPYNFSLNVMIPSRLCEAELSKLSRHIYNKEHLSRNSESFIYYYINHYSPEAHEWGEARFDPEMDVYIYGIEADLFGKLGLRKYKKGTPRPKILGEWVDESIPGTRAFVERGDNVFLRVLDTDINEYNDYSLTKIGSQYRLNDEEYYEIDTDGNLGIHINNNLLYTCSPLFRQLKTHRETDCYYSS